MDQNLLKDEKKDRSTEDEAGTYSPRSPSVLGALRESSRVYSGSLIDHIKEKVPSWTNIWQCEEQTKPSSAAHPRPARLIFNIIILYIDLIAEASRRSDPRNSSGGKNERKRDGKLRIFISCDPFFQLVVIAGLCVFSTFGGNETVFFPCCFVYLVHKEGAGLVQSRSMAHILRLRENVQCYRVNTERTKGHPTPISSPFCFTREEGEGWGKVTEGVGA